MIQLQSAPIEAVRTINIRFSISPGAVGLDLDPTDKAFFFADSGSPGSPN